LELPLDGVAAAVAALHAAGVGHERERARLGPGPGRPGRLDPRARAEEKVAGPAAGAGEAAGRDDPGDPHVPGLPVEEDGERLARAGAEGVGQVLVDDPLAMPRGGAAQPGAARAAERGCPGEVDLPDAGPWLGLAGLPGPAGPRRRGTGGGQAAG